MQAKQRRRVGILTLFIVLLIGLGLPMLQVIRTARTPQSALVGLAMVILYAALILRIGGRSNAPRDLP